MMPSSSLSLESEYIPSSMKLLESVARLSRVVATATSSTTVLAKWETFADSSWSCSVCTAAAVAVLILAAGTGMFAVSRVVTGRCESLSLGSFLRFFWLFQSSTAAVIRESHSEVPTFGPFMVIARSVWSISTDNLLLSLVLARFKALHPRSGQAFDTGIERHTSAM